MTRFRRLGAQPNGETFSSPVIRDFINAYVKPGQVVIDPFARNSRLGTIRNDLNPTTEAEYHLAAATFLELLIAQGVKADIILFDPPYSIGQSKQLYEWIGVGFSLNDAQQFQRYTLERKLAARLLKVGGYALKFGWNSTRFYEGFEIVEIVLICHGSAHPDTICSAQRKTCEQLDLF